MRQMLYALLVHVYILGSRNRWSPEELLVFEGIWTSRPSMPTNAEIIQMMAALPSRSKAVLRAKANYMLRNR